MLIRVALFLSTLSLRRATPSPPQDKSSKKFLSTLSLRRATLAGPTGPAFLFNFYPRSPCGERRPPSITPTASRNFYPRSPCGERRVHYDNYNLHCVISIHALLAESDLRVLDGSKSSIISIHALLAESDIPNQGQIDQQSNFYPRSPCGERRFFSLWCILCLYISIHALLAESDDR